MILSLPLHLTPRPSLRPSTCSCLSALRHGDVFRSDCSFPHPLHSSTDLYKNYSLRKAVRTALRAVEFRRANRTCSVKGYYATFSMTSYTCCQKGVTNNPYGGSNKLAAFVLRSLFHGYYFLVQIFLTSLTMAISDRVESSSALPRYQSPRRHDSKNTTFHIPVSTRFFMPSSGQHQITSPVDR